MKLTKKRAAEIIRSAKGACEESKISNAKSLAMLKLLEMDRASERKWEEYCKKENLTDFQERIITA